MPSNGHVRIGSCVRVGGNCVCVMEDVSFSIIINVVMPCTTNIMRQVGIRSRTSFRKEAKVNFFIL